ncbi:MFS transporter [Burkholderia gladioli]|uniref:MFS transporter n=2 Tax=Burkholderia gladioli TaxID=28095 RepID=UPI00215934D8|nr:MFS transporter [Burkholderia gladioli]
MPVFGNAGSPATDDSIRSEAGRWPRPWPMNRKLLLLLCVSVPSFMINLDANIVAVSLSSIAKSLHADFSAIEWVISSYTLAFASLLMPAGALADRFGRKRILIIGLSIFTLASFFCGAASVSIVLNLARAMQGVGAALLLSAALAVLSHAFHGKERAKAFAFWGSVIGVAVMMGPVVGGLITQLLGWRWAFYVNLPIGVAMIALTAWTVSESKDPGASKLDGMGVLLFSGFLGLLTWGLISGNREGWGDASVLLRIGVALVLFVAFVLMELREKRPMVELAYFAKKTYLGASVAGIAYPVTFLTMLTYLPFFFQTALHRSPLEAGLLMLPLAVPLFAVPRVVSVHLEHRLSGRALLSIGLVLVAAGLAVASVTVQLLSYAAVVVPMFVASLGGGILNGQVAKVSMTVIPVERAGMASGVAGTLRFSGLVLGFAALGAVLVDRIAADVQLHYPLLDAGRQLAMTRLILDGHLGDAASLAGARDGFAPMLEASLAQGYTGLLAVASALAFLAAALCWRLVDPLETRPLSNAAPVAIQALPE